MARWSLLGSTAQVRAAGASTVAESELDALRAELEEEADQLPHHGWVQPWLSGNSEKAPSKWIYDAVVLNDVEKFYQCF